jgi:hypothetical protein
MISAIVSAIVRTTYYVGVVVAPHRRRASKFRNYLRRNIAIVICSLVFAQPYNQIAFGCKIAGLVNEAASRNRLAVELLNRDALVIFDARLLGHDG